jgi:TolA-binding protein
MFAKTIIGAALIAFTASAALAQTKDPAATPGVDKRQEAQQKRIDQGVQSGQLNQKEAARLERRQERIEKMEDKAKADGVVTKQERKQLHHAQNQESRRIHHERHDRQHAKK